MSDWWWVPPIIATGSSVIGTPASLAWKYVASAISQTSYSRPRTIRAKAEYSGDACAQWHSTPGTGIVPSFSGRVCG